MYGCTCRVPRSHPASVYLAWICLLLACQKRPSSRKGLSSSLHSTQHVDEHARACEHLIQLSELFTCSESNQAHKNSQADNLIDKDKDHLLGRTDLSTSQTASCASRTSAWLMWAHTTRNEWSSCFLEGLLSAHAPCRALSMPLYHAPYHYRYFYPSSYYDSIVKRWTHQTFKQDRPHAMRSI